MSESPEPVMLERLRGCLASPFTDVVLHGLEAAADRHDPTLARWVLPCLDSPQSVVRRRAARVLGQLGSRSAAEALVLRLEDEDPGVALEAAWALEQVRPTDEVVAARRDRAAAELRGKGPEEPVLATPPPFEEAPDPVASPPARRPPASPPRPPATPAPSPPPSTGGEVGPGTDLGMLLSSLEENAERRAERSDWPRVELLLICAFLGFVFGRFLPGMREEPTALPPPAGRLTRERARELLFPGEGVLARLGRGAALVLEDDSRGVALLDEAVTEYHFAPGDRWTDEAAEGFRLELESERNPLGPPRTWRPPGDEAQAATTPSDASAPPEVPAWARGRDAAAEAPPTVAELPPASSLDGSPSMVSRAEETLFKAAARRYVEAGDRQHAIELLETLTGRNFPGDELERYLAAP